MNVQRRVPMGLQHCWAGLDSATQPQGHRIRLLLPQLQWMVVWGSLLWSESWFCCSFPLCVIKRSETIQASPATPLSVPYQGWPKHPTPIHMVPPPRRFDVWFSKHLNRDRKLVFDNVSVCLNFSDLSVSLQTYRAHELNAKLFPQLMFL